MASRTDARQTCSRARSRNEGFDATQTGILRPGAQTRQAAAGYDRFRGRLMFPIQDESGKVIAFGGRALRPEQEPKYLNSSETPILPQEATSCTAFTARRARSARIDRAVLVEGYMDVIGVWSAGVSEVVASCGTALVSQQVRALRRHSEQIVVNFDPDPAGRESDGAFDTDPAGRGHAHPRAASSRAGSIPTSTSRERRGGRTASVSRRRRGYFHWLADRARAQVRHAQRRRDASRACSSCCLRSSASPTGWNARRSQARWRSTRRRAGLVLEHFRKAATERREQSLPDKRRP